MRCLRRLWNWRSSSSSGRDITRSNTTALSAEHNQTSFPGKMAAMGSTLTPVCLAGHFILRQSAKVNASKQLRLDIWKRGWLQRSLVHTGLDRSRSSASLLRRQCHEKQPWVALRHNSSQTPSVGAPPLAADGALIAQQALPEQMALRPVSVMTVDDPVLASGAAEIPPTPHSAQAADVAAAVEEALLATQPEARLAELGLAGHTPVGVVQNLLEFMHMDVGLPWWAAIVVGTVVARLALFPFIVKGQREAAKLNNVMPEMSRLSAKMSEAKQSGNKFDFAKAYSDMTLFQKKHDVNPFRGFLIPLVQAPVFISFFMALRKMAYLPVPSMQHGGTLWFPDLTAADPFYILPLAVTGTMFFILELGAESGVDNPNLRAMKTVFRIMPFVVLPLTINFPTAVFTYWLTSNCVSLAQVALLKHPLVRQKLRVPERIKHATSDLPQNDGFIESMKKGWKNAQLAQQLQERERRIKNHLDLAAKGPLRQTFTHNPVQQIPSPKDKKSLSKTKPWKDVLG
ncbi:mitochondrial inner membrane protein OXA1L isoform X2 [Stigmatopora argus]